MARATLTINVRTRWWGVWAVRLLLCVGGWCINTATWLAEKSLTAEAE